MNDQKDSIHIFPHHKYTILVGSRIPCEEVMRDMGIPREAAKIVSPSDVTRELHGFDGTRCVMLLCYGWKEGNLDTWQRITYYARQANMPVLEVIR